MRLGRYPQGIRNLEMQRVLMKSHAPREVYLAMENANDTSGNIPVERIMPREILLLFRDRNLPRLRLQKINSPENNIHENGQTTQIISFQH